MNDDIPYVPEANIVVSAETWEWLLRELERPPRVNPKMVELLRQTRGHVKHD